MKMNAAVLWGVNEDWRIEELELDGPQEGEVLVSFEATGLCHTDHHVRAGDSPGPLPMIGGHEGGAVVLTAAAAAADVTPTLPMLMFTLYQKRLLGSLYGEANPRADIPRLLSLYREGKLLLDETVTTEYKLNDINSAYDDMLAGRNIRGVVIHDH